MPFNMNDDRITNYIESKFRPASEKLGEFRLSAENAHVPILTRETETFMRSLLQIKRPMRIVEIGTGVGYSSCVFAHICPDATITTHEMIEKRYLEAQQNISRFGFENRISVVRGDARETLDELSGDFDFVFIDSAKSWYRVFFEKVITHMKAGGIIVSDNVLLSGKTASDEYMEKHRDKTSMNRMRDYLDFLTEYEYADTSILSIGDGLAISVIR